MEAIAQAHKLTDDVAAQLHKLTDDVAAHLRSAARSLEEREERLTRQQEQLEEEKQRMAAFVEYGDGDLVEINVGGEVLKTERSTLLLAEGTLLEAMFSGRWEQSLKRDEAGRVFLDLSPVPSKAILSFLRAKRITKPEDHIASPVVPSEYMTEYNAMVKYLNLTELFQCKKCVVPSCPAGALICSQSTGGTSDGSIQISGGVLRGGNRDHRCAVGRLELLGEGGRTKAAWKVTVKALVSGGWFGAGVISHISPEDRSFSEPTCWAWASGTPAGNQVRVAGREVRGHGGWTEWAQGDIAVFQLDTSTGLRMFLRRSRQVYHIMQGASADVMKQARVHLNFHEAGTEIEVSQVTAQDLAEAGF